MQRLAVHTDSCSMPGTGPTWLPGIVCTWPKKQLSGKLKQSFPLVHSTVKAYSMQCASGFSTHACSVERVLYIHHDGCKRAALMGVFSQLLGVVFFGCFLHVKNLSLLVCFLSSWRCTVAWGSLVFLLDGVYSSKMKGANWLKLVCHQGRSLVNIFSLWNMVQKCGTFSNLVAQLCVPNS